jgi:uncharacterized OB-fold protein
MTKSSMTPTSSTNERRIMARVVRSAFLPPRPICVSCHGSDLKWWSSWAAGWQFDTSWWHRPVPGRASPNNYIVGVVELRKGSRRWRGSPGGCQNPGQLWACRPQILFEGDGPAKQTAWCSNHDSEFTGF